MCSSDLIGRYGNVPQCPFAFPECPVRKQSATDRYDGSHRAHRPSSADQKRCRYAFQRSRCHRPATAPHLTAHSSLCIEHESECYFSALRQIYETENASGKILKRSVQVGDYLFSRAVSSELSWARVSLTSVFGMGTGDRKSTRLNSSHANESRMPSSA